MSLLAATTGQSSQVNVRNEPITINASSRSVSAGNSPERRTTLASLPDDLFISLIPFLTNREVILYERVSSQWRKLLKIYFESLVKNFITNNTISHGINFCNHNGGILTKAGCIEGNKPRVSTLYRYTSGAIQINILSVFIGENAKVGSLAQVYGFAQIRDNASIQGFAQIYGNAQVYGNARVCNMAKVGGNAQVYGNARVEGIAEVSGETRICGDTHVDGNMSAVLSAELDDYLLELT